jgi:hypothetical protein
MDKKTREMLRELDELSRYNWPPGEKILGGDVHGTIAFLKGVTRCLRLGTVVTERERKEKIESRLRSEWELRRFGEEIGLFLDTVDAMNDRLCGVVDGILISLGYHRYNRGEWRSKCNSTLLLRFRNAWTECHNKRGETILLSQEPIWLNPTLIVWTTIVRTTKIDSWVTKCQQHPHGPRLGGLILRNRKLTSPSGELMTACVPLKMSCSPNSS